MIENVCKIITEVRNKTPLVHSITNYVTINDCANILLSFGASPAMVEAYDESYDFASISSSIYVNVGTLTKEQEQAAIMAGISAKNNNVPLILDPVGCGAIKRKINFIEKLFKLGRIDVIKGNASEIKSLAGLESKSRGVDSLDNENVLEACISLSQKYNCVVAATGKEDVITDRKRSAIIKNGTEMLTLITGAGCMVGALTAATSAIYEDKFISTVSSILSMNIAGEKAAQKYKTPGSFKVGLIDEIYLLNEEKLLKEGNVKCL
ncbi:hydroxyethylthiazole kinase [Clostridium brassicae]|uniref:Hydroxyethylthiazole kinase n=1 Tax=Clostridium brassicae TaxID=2999072 RepID=A0ABT4DCW2_9CLOT|nr:hydroxyethylthiazole kinase [Clostridium brassicae]MCY6960023.1 hydroxyethylthiazole kinase [Clostridium brassicae]